MFYSRTILLIFLALVLCQLKGYAQDITQTIRGSVTDSETESPLLAATVAVYSVSTLVDASITDEAGVYRIENVPVGRYSVVCSFIGYRQVVVSDVIVSAGKEVILPVELEESPVAIDEVSIRATGGKGEALNKMAFVSARTFSVEESNRYAGSRGDPARMASNYAGVQGSDDSNNDLVIRGNSPLGVLWRYEGVNIPNPNHFGASGTTGGPVTILNNKVLAPSDFMTGAFPAEYGNSNAGVFDIRMRNGNNEKHEFSGQLGNLGAELMAEGPLHKGGGSSYLVAYRYSTLFLIAKLGIDIGADEIKYQDLNFKLNLPTRNSGNFSLFGMGGKAYTEILASKQTKPDADKVYGDQDMDEHFGTAMGVTGLNYSKALGSSSYIKVTLAASREQQTNHQDKVYRHIENEKFVIDTIIIPFNGYTFNQNKYSANLSWNRKMNRQHSLRAGFIFDVYQFDMEDSTLNEVSQSFITRLDHQGFAFLSQPYVQWKYKASDQLTLNAGLHAQLLQLEGNGSKSLEPRLGVNYRPNEHHMFSYGTGLHSQMVPTYIYFTMLENQQGDYVQPNTDLGFIRSFHQVFSWNYYLNSDMRIKTELYYQYLYKVPVDYTASSYSVLDEGHDIERFFPDSLVNRGKGRNYGMELTVEKFFSKSYFMMLTASLYDAKRTGSDGKYYDALFNGRYVLNLLGSKEFSLGTRRNQSITVGGKITFAGGKRFTPVDLEASAIEGEAVYLDGLRNTMQFKPYFRADMKLNYRFNAAKTTHELGVDLVNITDRENVLKQFYVSGAEPPLLPKNQLPFLPIFYYKIDF
jgi:hypothetical protein